MSENPNKNRTDWNAAVSEILTLVFKKPGFCSATLLFKDGETEKITVRPVLLHDDCLWQFTSGAVSGNYKCSEARSKLSALLRGGSVKEAHVTSSDGDFHCRVAKRGSILVSRGRANDRRPVIRTHDHVKNYPLERHDFSKVLRALGFLDERGEIKVSMHGKYRQVNEFLRILDSVLDNAQSVLKDGHFSFTDVGCGKAYLSFAAKDYIEKSRNVAVTLVGVDTRKDVTEYCRGVAELMGCGDSAAFVVSDIADYHPESSVDMVVSLHACDTATDEALAFGVEHGAKLLLSAPCCQHELQKKLAGGLCKAVTRNGILRERLADILTDAFRAQILRVCGYRTSVVEFVEREATARNIMIKAVRTSGRGPESALTEYLELCEEWRCIPYLGTRLAGMMPELVPDFCGKNQ